MNVSEISNFTVISQIRQGCSSRRRLRELAAHIRFIYTVFALVLLLVCKTNDASGRATVKSTPNHRPGAKEVFCRPLASFTFNPVQSKPVFVLLRCLLSRVDFSILLYCVFI